jgi:hypothetical protein
MSKPEFVYTTYIRKPELAPAIPPSALGIEGFDGR